MSSVIQGAHIYTGPWVDWSRGIVLGSTITLSTRSGALLTAFLAFFITIIGACLWRICSYIIHQYSASADAKDGLHHQHQLIFRNTSSPAEATRAFAESAWSWRKNSNNSWSRSLPLVIFALVFMVGFSIASLLTSFVTKGAGATRLIVSDHCGFWALDSATSTESQNALVSKDLSDTITAAQYARTCYGKDAGKNAVECRLYVKQTLPWTANENAECPFGADICKSSAYSLDTGLLESHEDFGINAPASGRVAFRKVTTCAPLKQEGYVTVETADGTSIGAKGDRVRYYQYGTYIASGSTVLNATYWYDQHTLVDGFGYQLDAKVYSAKSGNVAWVPIDPLKRDDADTSIMFLSANSIMFYGKVNDPFFHADFEVPTIVLGQDKSFYMSTDWVNVMGCTDQYQFCTAKTGGKCTPLSGWFDTLANSGNIGLNEIQKVVAGRFALNLRSMSMSHSIGGRGAAALRAQETVSDLSQFPLPDNQWQVEVSGWFATGLARMQRAIVSYAAGFENIQSGSHIAPPDGPISRAMCQSQKVRQTSDGTRETISFSVLGIAVILVVGGLIIFIYLILEWAVAKIQKRYQWGDYRRLRWVMDDKMQIQRMAFEEAGMGRWQGLTNAYPVTEKGQVFGALHHVNPDEPRLGEKWTAPEPKMVPSSSSSQNGQFREHLDHDEPMAHGQRQAEKTPLVYERPTYQTQAPNGWQA